VGSSFPPANTFKQRVAGSNPARLTSISKGKARLRPSFIASSFRALSAGRWQPERLCLLFECQQREAAHFDVTSISGSDFPTLQTARFGLSDNPSPLALRRQLYVGGDQCLWRGADQFSVSRDLCRRPTKPGFTAADSDTLLCGMQKTLARWV
jgi:hypothetical protein